MSFEHSASIEIVNDPSYENSSSDPKEHETISNLPKEA
jgi:hypothetical protein